MRPLSLALLVACTEAVAPAPVQADADGDGILDVHEGEGDADQDGTPNAKDRDSDGDGIPDRVEAGDADLLTLPVDSDGDGALDFVDLDSDGNGLADAVEGMDDRDGDGLHDAADRDDDGDGVLDTSEMLDGDLDTDADGLVDRLDLDSDGDGIGDLWEGACLASRPCDTDGDTVPDARDDDSDDDGRSDRDERRVDGPPRTPPADTDGDGTADYRDPDSDGDGLPDADETSTSPVSGDTDGDGLSDQIEATLGLDPLDPASTWVGPKAKIEGRQSGSLPLEFRVGLARIDVVLALDPRNLTPDRPTYRTRELAYNAVQRLRDAMPLGSDFAAGVVAFGRYNQWGFSCHAHPGHPRCAEDRIYGVSPAVPDLPLIRTAPISRDLASVAFETAESMPRYYSRQNNSSGAAVIEGVYQLATGLGLDQHCDGAYEDGVDVPPFPSQAGDAFEGGVAWAPPSNLPPIGVEGGLGFRRGSLRVVTPPEDFLTANSQEAAADRWEQAQHLGVPLAPLLNAPSVCPSVASWDATVRAAAAANMVILSSPLLDVRGRTGTLNGTMVPDFINTWALLHDLSRATGWGARSADGSLVPYLTLMTAWNLVNENPDWETVVADFSRIMHDINDRMHPEVLSPVVENDHRGLVRQVHLDRTTGVKPSETVRADVELFGSVPPTEGDQAFVVTVALESERGLFLGEHQLLLIVPGHTSMRTE